MYRNLVPYFNPSNLPSIAENVLGLILSADKTETFINEHLSKMLYNLLRGLEQANSQFSDISQKVIRNMLKKTSQFDFTSVLQLF